MNTVYKLFITLFFILVLSPNVFAKEVIGWIENVHLLSGEVLIKAKMDTGAKSCSLHFVCIDKFLRDGEQWVRFTITDIDDQSVSYEKKILRRTKVKRHFGEVQERIVVRMGICIGDQYGETDVSLVDRSGFYYSLLIVRKYLKDKFIVDPGETFLSSPQCEIN